MFKKVYDYVKKYWKFFAAGLLFVVGLLLFRRNRTPFVDSFNAGNTAHNDEVNDIVVATKQKDAATKSAIKEYITESENIQNKYERSVNDAQRQSEETKTRIINNGATNPQSLADELKKAYGSDIRVIYPVKDKQ